MIWNVISPIENIQENLKNAYVYIIKDNILDIQDQQWPLIFYSILVPIWCYKKQSCKKIFRVFFPYNTEFRLI